MLTIKEVNETLATISRVVMHPKYRSIGLGEKLVKDTLPLVGRPYVEEKRKLILLSIPFVGINLLKQRLNIGWFCLSYFLKASLVCPVVKIGNSGRGI